MYQNIKTLYEFFYRKIYNQKLYTFCPSESAEKQIKNFINLLHKRYNIESLGDQFIVNYFIFQFKYWIQLDIQAFNKQINLSYIIGPKAFQRYIDRDVEFDWTLTSVVFKKTEILKSQLLRVIEITSDRKDELRYEELEKQRFQKSDRQFLHCIENTTLYTPKSKHCLTCTEKIECKNLLEEKYPQIFYHRFKK